MLEYLNTSDWCAALEKVIPARKRGGGSGSNEDGNGDVKRARTEQAAAAVEQMGGVEST